MTTQPHRNSWWLRERGYAQRVCALAMCILWVLPVSAAVGGNYSTAVVFASFIVIPQALLIIFAHRNTHKARIQHVLERFCVTPGDQA